MKLTLKVPKNKVRLVYHAFSSLILSLMLPIWSYQDPRTGAERKNLGSPVCERLYGAPTEDGKGNSPDTSGAIGGSMITYRAFGNDKIGQCTSASRRIHDTIGDSTYYIRKASDGTTSSGIVGNGYNYQ